MASGFSATASGHPPPHSDLRIVLLGQAGAGKSRITKAILKDTKLKEESEECVLYEGEQAGRKICIVDTPGWDRDSAECTTKKNKKEITRSVTLCPPGPSALILVFPVNTGDEPSLNDFESASRHIDLLSERVWNHSMVLFLCDGDVDEFTVKEHIQTAEKLLEKCQGRHYVMQQAECETQVHGLFKEIDSMVEENVDDFFLPQIYYEVMQRTISQDMREFKKRYKDREKMLKQGYQTRLSMYKEQTEKQTVKQRRGSVQGFRPSFNEDENQEALDIDIIRGKYRDELQALARHYFKPIVLIVLAVIGSLIGSVIGSSYGVLGSGVGIIVGIVVSIPLALCLISAGSVARQSSTFVEKRKPEHTD